MWPISEGALLVCSDGLKALTFCLNHPRSKIRYLNAEQDCFRKTFSKERPLQTVKADTTPSRTLTPGPSTWIFGSYGSLGLHESLDPHRSFGSSCAAGVSCGQGDLAELILCWHNPSHVHSLSVSRDTLRTNVTVL